MPRPSTNKPLKKAQVELVDGSIIGRIVQVYFNTTRQCWSVRDKQTRKVIAYPKNITLHGHIGSPISGKTCRFHVGQSGRDRVVREKRKNIHAWVEGKVIAVDLDVTMPRLSELGAERQEAEYDPYRMYHFINKKTWVPVGRAATVQLTEKGRVFFFETKRWMPPVPKKKSQSTTENVYADWVRRNHHRFIVNHPWGTTYHE